MTAPLIVNGVRRASDSSSRSRSSGGTSRTVQYVPSLLNHSSDLHLTQSRKKLTSTAISFLSSHILHTQLQYHSARPLISLRISSVDPTTTASLTSDAVLRPLWHALYPYVARGQDSEIGSEVEIELPLPSSILHAALVQLGAKELHPNYVLPRSAIFQLFSLASASPSITYPETFSPNSPTVPHRPPKPSPGAEVYSRHIPHLSQYFSLRHLSFSSHDAQLLNTWMNEPRVSAFWGEDGPISATESFIKGRMEDEHNISVVGSYMNVSNEDGGEVALGNVGEEAIYSEIYWVKEDKLGSLLSSDPARQSHAYDRGIHVLVGSNAHRGPHRIRAWLPSLVHYCFLADPRTERVVAEPNQINDKMIKYFESVGFERRGEVVFPHKTSAYMVCERKRFFELCPM